MDTFLNIIKFIYQKKGSELDIDSMDDFDEGVYFPQFITLLFDEKVKKLKKKLEGPADILHNFRASLTFIRKKNIIVKNFMRLPTSDEKEEILLKIITGTYFTMSTDDIFKQLKPILESQDLEGDYENVNKIFSGKFLLTLLSILTDGNIAMPNAVKKPDFEDDIVESLQKVDVPIVIDSDSFKKNNKRFLIQIQIIFIIFSDKIQKIKSVHASSKDAGRLYALRKKIKKSITGNIKLLEPLDDDDDDDKEIHKSDANVLKKDYYQDNNAILNIVNSLIKDDSQKIDFLSAFFTENLDRLFTIVKDVTGTSTEITDYDEMLDLLGDLFPENRSFFANFTKTRKSQFIEFIKIILNNSYFNSTEIELLRSRCQAIFHEFQINFTDLDELYKSKGLLFLPLLQKVAFKKYSDIDFVSFPPEKELTFNELHVYFDQLNIPFVLDNNSFSQYQDIEKLAINYQTKLIIDQFDVVYLNKIEANNSVNDESLSPLLKTINLIGLRKGMHFHSLESIVDGCLLPCFVECLLQEQLRDELGINKSQQLTKAQSDKNIDIIIQYLKSRKDKFSILLFEFNDPQMKSKSVKRLCKNLINLFFIKTSRKEILERCDSIVGIKCPIKSVNDFVKGKGFFALLHYIKHFNIGFNKTKIQNSGYNRLKDLFKKVNILMILTEDLFYNPTNDEDTIFCQLQIIFDKLDNEIHKEKPGLVVTEIFLQATNILSKVNILEYHIFKISSEAKMKSQENRKPRVFNSTKKEIANTQNKKIPTYHIDDLIKLKEKEEKRMNSFDNVLNTGKDTLSYWNPFDDEYRAISNIKLQNYLSYNDKLLCSNRVGNTHLHTPDYSKLLLNDLKTYFKNAETFKLKKKEAKKQGRLYKFYVYNEELKKWVFNSDEFQLYVKDCKIGVNASKLTVTSTSLILVFNSNEEDLVALKSSNFKDSAIEDDKLFIYSLSYKYEDDYYEPTFLFLHVPSKNIDNLAYAITQIYIYLYAISDVQLLLLNFESESFDEKIHKQIEMIKMIDQIAKRLNIKINNQSKLVFLANYSVPSYEKRFCNNLQNGKFAKEIKELKMDIIPFGFDTDNVFNEIVNDITQNFHYSDEDLLTKLQNYPEYEISGLYLRVVTQPSDKHYDDVLKGIIKERVGYFNDTKKPDKNSYLLLLDEFAFFTPQNDMEFNQKYRYMIYQILSQIPDKKMREFKLLENELDTELDKFSKNMMSGFQKFILSELFWEDQQISILLNSYSMLLEKAFYCIIFTTGYGRIADIIYIENAEILRKQKDADNKKIRHYFDKFNKTIIQRTEEKDLQNDLIKSTKYIMKETENLKDREVLVNSGQNLEDVIEQDF